MGPADHGYSDEFQRIARRLIGYYLRVLNRGRRPVPVLRLTTDYGDIVVKPDLALSTVGRPKAASRLGTGKEGPRQLGCGRLPACSRRPRLRLCGRTVIPERRRDYSRGVHVEDVGEPAGNDWRGNG